MLMNRGRLAALCAGALWVLLAGCAPLGERAPVEQRVPPMGMPGQEPLEAVWWQACFRMPFDGEGQPRWAVDLLLADRVVAPALTGQGSPIPLWRFHRRAAPDRTGHQFSLIFYTDEATAERVFDALVQAPELEPLREAGYLDRVITHCRHEGSDPALAATSDPNWDPRLQRSWPYFIMGVSAHWLALVREVGGEIAGRGESPGELLARYREIEEEVNALWERQGQHAYLHHLSGVFGYQPMLIQRFIRF